MTEASPLACPLCGQNNQCAVTQGKEASSCWCQTVNIEPEILKQLSSEQKNTMCLCSSCASKSTEPS